MPEEPAQIRSQRSDRGLGNAPALRVKRTGFPSLSLTPSTSRATDVLANCYA
jgi:hypothetical protein